MGEGLMTDFRRNMVKVSGVNLRKVRDDEGKYKFIEKKVHYSNCALLDPVHRKPTRVGLHFSDENDVVRISKLSGYIIPWPDSAKDMDKDPEKVTEGPKDTDPEVALKKTYDY